MVRLRTLKHKKSRLLFMYVDESSLKKLKHFQVQTYDISERILSLSGDVEENPGPSDQCNKNLGACSSADNVNENADDAFSSQYKRESAHSATENYEMISYQQLFPNRQLRPANQNIFEESQRTIPQHFLFSSRYNIQYFNNASRSTFIVIAKYICLPQTSIKSM